MAAATSSSDLSSLGGGDYGKLIRLAYGARHLLQAGNGSSGVDVAEIIVVGDQSAGKSTVMEAITGIKFPSGEETTTKCPTSVLVRPCKDEEEPATLVNGKEVDNDDAVTEAIAQAQIEILDGQGGAETAAVAASSSVKVTGFSDTHIRVEAIRKGDLHLSVVDMPGLVANDHGLEEGSIAKVRKMNLDAIRNPRAVVLVIAEASRDVQTQAAVQLAKKVDPGGIRTLVIKTKCDLVANAVQKDSLKSSIERASYTAASDPTFAKFCPHFVAVRDTSGSIQSSKQESAIFATYLGVKDADNVVGIGSLRKRLMPLLGERIQCTIRATLADIIKAKRAQMKILTKLGEVAPTTASIMTDALRVLEEGRTRLPRDLHDLLEGEDNNDEKLLRVFDSIVSDESEMEKVVGSLISSHDVPAHFVAQAVRERLGSLGELYKAVLDEYCSAVMTAVDDFMCAVIGKACHSTISEFKLAIMGTFREHYFEPARTELRLAFRKLSSKGSRCFTRNAHYVDDVDSDIDEKQLVEQLALKMPTFTSSATLDDKIALLGPLLRSLLKDAMPRSMKEQVQQRALRELYRVGKAQHKTLVDSVNGDIGQHVVVTLDVWLSSLASNEHIREHAKEEASAAYRRQQASDRLKRLRDCEALLRNEGIVPDRDADADAEAAVDDEGDEASSDAEAACSAGPVGSSGRLAESSGDAAAVMPESMTIESEMEELMKMFNESTIDYPLAKALEGKTRRGQQLVRDAVTSLVKKGRITRIANGSHIHLQQLS